MDLGYQVTGWYAPTSRYGTPDEFGLSWIAVMPKIGGSLTGSGHFPDGHGLAFSMARSLRTWRSPHWRTQGMGNTDLQLRQE